MTKLTLWSTRTESSHVQRTSWSPYMFLFALGTLWTESSLVILALSHFCLLFDVQIETLVSAIAVSKCSKESTFWHSSQVIFVQVVAIIFLFAKAS
jgi:hypothetical protein